MKLNRSLLFATLLTQPSSAALFSAEHGDIGIAYEEEVPGEGPEFFLHYHLGPNAILDGAAVGNGPDGEEFEPGDIITLVSDANRGSMPEMMVLNTGTGVAAGNPIWTLPSIDLSGVPFLGIATEELSPSEFLGDVTFTMTSVTSPSGSGNFSVWQQSGVNPPDFFFSTASASDNKPLTMGAGAHDHFNYGFSEPGLWEVELSVTATHVTDGVLTDTETFRFQVVPEPGTAFLGLLGALGLFRRQRSLAARG